MKRTRDESKAALAGDESHAFGAAFGPQPDPETHRTTSDIYGERRPLIVSEAFEYDIGPSVSVIDLGVGKHLLVAVGNEPHCCRKCGFHKPAQDACPAYPQRG